MSKVFDVSRNKSQEQFLEAQERVIAFAGGVGSGKSAVGAVKAIQKISEGKSGIIVAPDFPQFARATWPEFSKWAPWSYCTNAHLDHPFSTKKKLTFDIRGQLVEVYYGGIDNPQSWAGVNINWVWLDEGGRIRTRSAFDTLLGRMRVPPDPQFWTTTTPVGVNHWLYEVFVKGIFPEAILDELREQGYKGDLTRLITASTEMNKHNLDPMYYLTLKGMYSGKLAQQELEGKFITMEGLVWEQFGQANITNDADYVPGVPVEWWVDDGFTKGHPRVILLAQVIPPYINVFEEYISEYELAESSIKAAMDKGYPKPSVAYVDSSAAELRNRLWNQDIDTVKATHSVEEGIKRTAAWICDGDGHRGLRFHPRCSFSIKEMQSYVRDERTGKPVKEADNACLVGATLVSSTRGEVPIKDIVVGDMVHTPIGARQVTASQMTQRDAPLWEVRLSDGTTLRGTRNHPLFIIGREMTRIDQLRAGDRVRVFWTDEETVLSVCELGENEDVYDLTVEEAHCFYANGVLVSNSDATRYGLVYKDRDEIISGGTEEYRNRVPIDSRDEPLVTVPTMQEQAQILTNQDLMNYYLSRWATVGGRNT